VNDGKSFKFSTWDMEVVRTFHETGVSIVGLHSFQPFNSPLHMHVTIKINMPILTSNHIFPNSFNKKKIKFWLSLLGVQLEFLKQKQKIIFILRPIIASRKPWA
jgi:hypothetical protein